MSISRSLALATSVAALAATGAAPAMAGQQAALSYQCKYPLIGTQVLDLSLDTAFPTSWPRNKPTSGYAVHGDIDAYGFAQAYAGVTEPGTASGVAYLTYTSHDAAGATQALPVNAFIPPVQLAAPVTDPLELVADGSLPSTTFPNDGFGTFTLDNFQLSLALRQADGSALVLPPLDTDLDGNPVVDSDGNPDTFDVYCKLAEGADSTVAIFNILGGPTPSPSDPTPTIVPPTPSPDPGEPTPTPAPADEPTPTPEPT
ncbi:MAG: hypothetical protein J7513_17975, partial [Solirubrobacteraceae bacterium]|nr:hypothetical protein [Solirubrobacteraceae bacterium]